MINDINADWCISHDIFFFLLIDNIKVLTLIDYIIIINRLIIYKSLMIFKNFTHSKISQNLNFIYYFFIKIIRLKKTCINKDRMKDININSRTRKLVEYKCILHCYGSKWVNLRTFEKYQWEINQFRTITFGSQDSSQLKSIKSKPVDIRISSSKKRKKQKVRSEKVG